MPATMKPLLAMTAADLMSRDVVAAAQEMSLRGAAHMLSQAEISGAPVVDEHMRCVGVLSATDFVHWAEKGCTAALTFSSLAEPICDWEVVDVNVLPTDEVRAYMTADPVTTTPSTPISDLARSMIDAHIHRIIVVDENDRPIGIVSSTDVLAAVARCDDEA